MFAGKPSDEIPLRLCLLYVSDLDRSISFYQEVVGLRLASRDTIARFDIDGTMFECVPAPSQGSQQTYWRMRVFTLSGLAERETLQRLPFLQRYSWSAGSLAGGGGGSGSLKLLELAGILQAVESQRTSE